MKVLIIDDDFEDSYRLKQLFLTHPVVDESFDVDMVHSLKDIDQNQSYDIYVFDIEIHHEHSFPYANQIMKKYPNASLIFYSSHNELIYDSLDYNVFHFIRKDHLETDFVHTIKKLRQSKSKFLQAKIDQIELSIHTEQIVYIESNKNYVYLHLNTNQEAMMRSTIKQIQQELQPYHFVQISREFIVNLEFVKDIRPFTLTLESGLQLPISIHQYKKVNAQFAQYQKGLAV